MTVLLIAEHDNASLKMAEKMGLTDDQLDAFLKKNGH